MINIYLDRPVKVKDFNDAFFNTNYTGYKFGKTDKDIIKAIDDVDYLGKFRIKSKFYKGTAIRVTELSTGCKTVLNVVNNPDEIFSIAECGENAIKTLFALNTGNIYIPYFILPPQSTAKVKVYYKNNSRVLTRKELEILFNEVRI